MGEDDSTAPAAGVKQTASKRTPAKTRRAGSGSTPEPPREEPTPSAAPDSEADSYAAESRYTLRVGDIEPLLERGDYDKVCDLLGPPDRASALPPRLALLYVAARGELGHGPALADLPHLAMETSGRLLEMPARSHASRLVAKRLLGLSSPAVRGRMVRPSTRILIVAAALLVGGVLGWLMGRMA